MSAIFGYTKAVTFFRATEKVTGLGTRLGTECAKQYYSNSSDFKWEKGSGHAYVLRKQFSSLGL